MKKNKIKCIASALSLSMLMGISQPMGTLASFTDTVIIKGNQTISTGTVDVSLWDLGEVSDGACRVFKIENTGTLDQNIKIKLSGELLENHENLELEYSLGKQDVKVKIENDSIEIPNRMLKTDEIIKLRIYAKEKDNSKSIDQVSENKLNLNIEVDAKQIGNVEKGFTDREVINDVGVSVKEGNKETNPDGGVVPELEENPDEDKSPESEENPTTKPEEDKEPESEENPATKPEEDKEPDPEENPTIKPEEDVEPESEENPPTKPEEDIVPDPEENPATKPEEDVVPDPEENPVTKPEEEQSPESEENLENNQ